MNRAKTLRIFAVVLALAAALSHLALSILPLIPGENTLGPMFAGMGIGYLVGTVGIFLRRRLFYQLVLIYALALILAYFASRDMLPVEPIGLLTKLDEGLLMVSLWLLLKTRV